MQLFFCPEIEHELCQLGEDESKHCINVLRHKTGDIIHLVDGKGGFFKAEIIKGDKRNCEIKILEKKSEFGKRNYKLHIAIAPPKNIERFEWFLEKATEIGIDQITPLVCERSERKDIKPERSNKVIVAAMKQSIKAYLPELNQVIKFKDFITRTVALQKYTCNCNADKNSTLKNLYIKDQDVLLLIGPEGDFTNDEIAFADSCGFKTISLGESRLRTETAGIVACQIISFINS